MLANLLHNYCATGYSKSWNKGVSVCRLVNRWSCLCCLWVIYIDMERYSMLMYGLLQTNYLSPIWEGVCCGVCSFKDT